MTFRISVETRAVDDGELGQECFQLGHVRAAQKVADEQAMPR